MTPIIKDDDKPWWCFRQSSMAVSTFKYEELYLKKLVKNETADIKNVMHKKLNYIDFCEFNCFSGILQKSYSSTPLEFSNDFCRVC